MQVWCEDAGLLRYMVTSTIWTGLPITLWHSFHTYKQVLPRESPAWSVPIQPSCTATLGILFSLEVMVFQSVCRFSTALIRIQKDTSATTSKTLFWMKAEILQKPAAKMLVRHIDEHWFNSIPDAEEGNNARASPNLQEWQFLYHCQKDTWCVQRFFPLFTHLPHATPLSSQRTSDEYTTAKGLLVSLRCWVMYDTVQCGFPHSLLPPLQWKSKKKRGLETVDLLPAFYQLAAH